jgi:hypothetical protein
MQQILDRLRITRVVMAGLLALAIALPAAAQGPPALPSWFGGTADDLGWAIERTTDGNYIIAGRTRSEGAGGSDAQLLKVDELGNVLWSHTHGGAEDDEFKDVQLTADGGYIAAGSRTMSGVYYAYLVKTDVDGNVAWERTYGAYCYANAVQQTPDGGYVFTGKSTEQDPWGDVNLRKVDSAGLEQWSRYFNLAAYADDSGHSVALTPDGGYIVAGFGGLWSAGQTRMWVIKTDAAGNQMWNTQLGTTPGTYNMAQDVLVASDGNYVVAGHLHNGPEQDPVLIKLDPDGATLWIKNYGGAGDDHFNAVTELDAGGFAVLGSTSAFGAGGSDAYLVFTDNDGNELSSRTFGGAGDEYGTDVVGPSAGQFALAGYSNSSGAGGHDMYFVRAPVVSVSVPDLAATYNEVLTIPVSLNEAGGLVSAEVFLEYDTSLLTVFSDPNTPTSSQGTLTETWTVETNTESGAGSLETLKIAMATDQSSVTGPVTLINVKFTVNDVRTPASSPLTLTHVLLNDGSPTAVPTDGSVTLVGNDGTITSLPAQIIPRETITLTVVDLDADLDGLAGTNQVAVNVENTTTNDLVVLSLDEDLVTPGTFIGTVDTEFGVTAIADGLIQAQATEAIVSTFSDELDGVGIGPTPRTAQTDVIGGTDGTIAITLVSQPGDPLYIQVTDADLNASFSSAETASVTVTNSRSLESFTVTLTEVDIDDDVFFGLLPTTPGASTATDMNTAEEDIVTATYDDVVSQVGDQLDRTAGDDVIDPWGDADDNEALQAFDAAQVLLDVLSGGTFLTDLGRRSANVDIIPVTSGINTYDASLILMKRVGLIATFPVQDPTSENHPQGTPASPKGLPDVRTLSLRAEDGYLSVWVDERSDLLSGDLSIAGISGQVELGAELGDFLLASGKIEDGLRVVFAGAQEVSGPGELLRVYSGVGPDRVQLTRASFNNGEIEGRLDAGLATRSPDRYALHANMPNPFNPETAIRFDLPQAGSVTLEVFDVVGQKVRTLLAEEHQAGSHRALWDGTDDNGAAVSSGVYFYRMQAGEFRQVQKMTLLR